MTNSTAMTIRSRARAGFAFTEVLFAVMVLGLGFIMIAAMFPVTIRQTQSTLEETVGANVAGGAVDYLQSVASEDLFPPTTPVEPASFVAPPAQPNRPTAPRPAYNPDGSLPLSEFVSLQDVKPYVVPVYKNDPAPDPSKPQTPLAWGGASYNPDPTKNGFWPGYSVVRGNMIDPDNPAIAWVPFYRRDANSQYAQVIVIAVRNRERDRYVGSQNPRYVGPTSGQMYSDLDRPALPTLPVSPRMPATLEPVKVTVALQYVGSQSHGTVTIKDPPSGIAVVGRAAAGAYLVVATDPVAHPAPNRPGQLIGRIFQLGNPIDETGLTPKWELSPARDMVRSDPTKDDPQTADDDPNCTLADNVQAYLIGRGYVDPSDASKGFAGPAQDIAVYSSFISIPPRTTP